MVKHFYAMSDTHDDLEAVARAADFIKSEGLKDSYIIHAGDLALRPYTAKDLKDLLESGDGARFLEAKRRHNERVLIDYRGILDSCRMLYVAIPGNYDGSLKNVFGRCNIHNERRDYDGVTIVGYGGGGDADSPWIGPGHIQLLADNGEIEMFDPKTLDKLLRDNDPQIAVIHNPPQGFCDDMYNGKNVGTPTSRKYLEENNKLKLVVSGHIHEAGPNGNNPNGVRGVRAFRREDGSICYIVNPGNLGRFEMMNPETLETERQFPYGTFVRIDTEDDGTPISLTQYSVAESPRGIGQVKVMRKVDLKAAVA